MIQVAYLYVTTCIVVMDGKDEMLFRYYVCASYEDYWIQGERASERSGEMY